MDRIAIAVIILLVALIAAMLLGLIPPVVFPQ
jgi:hypothetical protein